VKIGIIGYGFVGKAVECGFRDKCEGIYLLDPAYPKLSCSMEEMVLNSKFIFIAVPTPMKSVDGGEFDSAILDQVLEDLYPYYHSLEKEERPVIILKSTTLPNVIRGYLREYPEYRLVMSPEFLVENDALRRFVNMDSLVLGGAPLDTYPVEELYKTYSICNDKCKVAHIDAVAASFLKYMVNCFLATKVIFMNQFHSLYRELVTGTDWDTLVDAMHQDPRTGNSHGQVPGPDGDYGVGGKCFPKDLNAMIYSAKEHNVNMSLLETVWDINKRVRSNWDWKSIIGAVSSSISMGDK